MESYRQGLRSQGKGDKYPSIIIHLAGDRQRAHLRQAVFFAGRILAVAPKTRYHSSSTQNHPSRSYESHPPMFKTSLISLGLLLAYSATGFGQSEKWTHYGIRPLAMGNAYVAVADDFNALFYNPAGLARLKTWDFEILNPSYEISDATLSFLEDIGNLGGDVDGTLDFLQGNSGTDQHMSFGITPHFVMPGFGFAIAVEFIGDIAFHSHPSADLRIGPKVVIPIGFGFNFLEDRLSVGFAVKARAQGGVDRRFGIGDIEAFKQNGEEGENKLASFIEGGLGIGGDVGLLFTPTPYMKPTFGLSITDIGDTPFEQQDVGGTAIQAPAPVLASVNAGFSLTPVEVGMMFIRTSVDVHSINQPFSFSKKLNLGVEWGFGEIIRVQAGLHQGYLSGGFQFDVGLFNIRAAAYTEELGTSAGVKPDQRYALQLKFLI